MKLKYLNIICFLFLFIAPFQSNADVFIAKRSQLKPYYNMKNVVMIASTGRSGSTMLTQQMSKYAINYNVVKTHLLPPESRFKGKILFIFSNPDKAAESALFMTLHRDGFGRRHFVHVETADRDWLKKIGDAHDQTEEDNLLSYDALGCAQHLEEWFHLRTLPCNLEEAQILAIKFENLWERNTVEAIKKFLKLKEFRLPPKRERGYDANELFPHELGFRKKYNLGTDSEPRYAAYDKARALWEQAQPFQFFKIAPKTE